MPIPFSSRTLLTTALAPCCLSLNAHAQSISAVPTFQMQFDQSRIEADGEEFRDDRLRRLRVGIKGAIHSTVNYNIQLDIDDDAYGTWTSVYFDLPISENIVLRVGQDKTPNSLEEDTSSRSVVFNERASFTDAFSFERALGASFRINVDDVHLSLGAYGENLNGRPFDGGYSLAGRLGKTSNNEQIQTYYGGSFRYRKAGDELFSYKARFPSAAPFDLVGSDIIAQDDLFVGAEFGLSRKNIWATAELGILHSGYDRRQADSLGGYLAAGYLIGGARSISSGGLTSPSIEAPFNDGGFGAIGVSARYDYLALAQMSSATDKAQTWNVSLDWWLNKNLRFALSAYHTRLLNDRRVRPNSHRIKDATGLVLRHQISF